MACCTRSDGASGFSLEASLMASWMPSSRSSSSTGFPGALGAIPRMCSLARDSDGVVAGGQSGGALGRVVLVHRHIGQVRRERVAAVLQHLPMREHALDLAQRGGAREQVLTDLQRDLAADSDNGLEEPVDRVVGR